MLAGFGVFALGRHHPVVRQAMHDVLDADLADLTQFDAPPLAGLLAEALLAKVAAPRPGLLQQQRHRGGRGRAEVRPLRDRAQADPLLRPRLPRPDRPARCRSTAPREFRKGFGPLLPDTAIAFGDLAALERELRARRRRRLAGRADPGQGRGRGAARIPGRGPGAAARAQGAADRRRGADAASAAPATSSPTSTTASSPTSSPPPRRSRAATSRSAPRWRRDWIFQKVYSSMDRVLVHDSTFGSNAQAMAAGPGHPARDGAPRASSTNARKTGELLQSPAGRAGRPLRDAARGARPRADDRHRVRPAVLAGSCAAPGRRCRRPARGCSRRRSCTRCSTSTAS